MENKQVFKFTAKDEDEQYKEVYAYFGLAVYTAQTFENQLVNMIVAMNIATGRVSTEQDIDTLFSRNLAKTMGPLIKSLQEYYNLSDKHKEELSTLLKTRNHIVHNYFKEKVDLFFSEKGRENIISELMEFTNKVTTLDEELQILSIPHKEKIGITKSLIEKMVEERIQRIQNIYVALLI